MDEHKDFEKISKGERDEMSIDTLNRTMQGMPEYQANISAFGRHIRIAKECANVFEKVKLKDTAMLEQTLATGFDDRKNKVGV
jgi:hypothetical protein